MPKRSQQRRRDHVSQPPVTPGFPRFR
jgi:hypothetical protein